MFKSRNEGDRHQFWGDVEILNPQQNPFEMWTTCDVLDWQTLDLEQSCLNYFSLNAGKTKRFLSHFYKNWVFLCIPRVFGKSAVEICCFTAATKQPATHCILPCCTSDTPRCREGAGAMAQSWPAPSGPWMAMGPWDRPLTGC